MSTIQLLIRGPFVVSRYLSSVVNSFLKLESSRIYQGGVTVLLRRDGVCVDFVLCVS